MLGAGIKAAQEGFLYRISFSIANEITKRY